MQGETPLGSTTYSDRYETLVCLGENEHSTTYLSKRSGDGGHVVLTIPSSALLAQGSFSYLLERAALECLRVKHPHILRVLDVGRSDSVPYVVTEYVEGGSLAQRVGESGSHQTVHEVYAWLLDIAEALDFIHAKKVTHGEVRPSHILFERTDHVRLTDYAFASAIAGLDGNVRRSLVFSRTGFTAPEVEDGAPPTPASDQYALAATVFLAIVGETVDPDPSRTIELLRSRVSQEATEDLLRGLATNPAERFASCYELARAFGLERKRLPLARDRNGGGAALAADEIALPELLERDGTGSMLGTSWPPGSAVGPDADVPRADLAPAGLPAPQISADARFWRMRLGPRDQYARAARDGDFVAAGWGELGDLRDLVQAEGELDLPMVVERYEQTYGVAGTPARIGAGQIWRFTSEMERGDIVIVPNPDDHLLHVGRIDSGAEWQETPRDGCRLHRRRRVTWLRDIGLGEIPNVIARRLGGPRILVSLDAHARVVRGLVASPGTEHPEFAEEPALLQGIVDALYALPLEQFASFVRSLFAALRYDAEVAPGRSDESWEAVGTVAAQGLAEVPLRVTISRSRRDLDLDAVLAARGALAADEQGAIVTLGEFTQGARSDAATEGRKPIRLIDGRTLAAMALEAWEALPRHAQAAMEVDRIEHATIEIRYESKRADESGS